ncbi:MAG: ATP-binding cassette domain-containing protein [Spirochaetes bacterium]|nr:ATP-binding cassette domain-containing protein [Spirochaetota bacterium]
MIHSDNVVEARDVVKTFTMKKGFFGKKTVIRAVDGVSLSIPKGNTYGLVGESGCGKTTLARTLLRLIEPDSGQIIILHTPLHTLSKDTLRRFRKNMQIVFQDPYGSLNPRMTVEKIISESLRIHENLSKEEVKEKTYALLSMVGLDASHAARYPHEFSGGQRQRICIARALAVSPSFVVLDEPISALDVSIQGQILNLLADIQDTLGVAYLFVAHNLAVVKHVSTMVGVMYLGKIVEENFSNALYKKPLHPYTKSLIASIPDIKPAKHAFQVVKGEIPSPENPPQGCHFHPRCQYAMPLCREAYPATVTVNGAKVACFLYH